MQLVVVHLEMYRASAVPRHVGFQPPLLLPAEFGVAAEIATAIRAITWWMVSEQWQRHHSCVVPLCAVSIRWRLC